VLVVGVLTRLLIDGTQNDPDEPPPAARFDRVTLVLLEEDHMLRDVFEPIARDGAHMLEVGLALQRAMALVADNTAGALQEAARVQAKRALDYARQGLRLDRERVTLLGWSLNREA
jgi:uncharacterized membrane protein